MFWRESRRQFKVVLSFGHFQTDEREPAAALQRVFLAPLFLDEVLEGGQ